MGRAGISVKMKKTAYPDPANILGLFAREVGSSVLLLASVVAHSVLIRMAAIPLIAAGAATNAGGR